LVTVTDPDDFFSQLDEAELVTGDDADSIQSSVEQTESAEHQESATTASESVTSTKSRRRTVSPRYVARCRFCRCKFKQHRIAVRHEGRCDAEPVSQCQYCGESHTRTDDPEIHLKTCEAYERAETRLEDEDDSDATVTDETSEAANSEDDGHFSRQFIDTQPHEFKAYLKWDCSDRENPLRSYFGLRSLQGEHDFEKHGQLRTSIDIEGEELNVEFGFDECGIAPRDSPNFELDEVREYPIRVYPSAYSSWDDARSEARKRAYFLISPRWPDIESKEGYSTLSNPYDIEGYDVEVTGSYWDFEQYPHILQQALSALADRQGFRYSNPTLLHPEDFAPDRIHRSSNIIDGELHVRVKDGKTGRVISFDGTLHRISHLLSGDQEGYTKTVRDDRECPGHYYTTTIDSRRAGQLIGDHELAKEFKHYHLRNPDAVEGTALENPKICVSFQNSIHDGTLYWDDLGQLVKELDEALLNVLEWSNIPSKPDDEFFVADDYFDVSGSRRWRKLLPDQLPRIESKQDDQLVATMNQMNSTDAELVDTLLTDGGKRSPKELAESIDIHLDTIYRALKRLSPLVDHTYGEVQLGSKYIAQELTGHIDTVTESIQSGLENALDGLTRAESYADDDPWSRWLDRYGAKISRTDDADPDELDVGFKPSTIDEARRILREGALKWSQVTDEPIRNFGFEFAPAITTVDGEHYAPKHFADALGTPG
jgi:predicted transcriptional regulator